MQVNLRSIIKISYSSKFILRDNLNYCDHLVLKKFDIWFDDS